MPTEPTSVADVVDGLQGIAEKKSKVSFGDVLDEFGTRSFAPIMMILALTELTPFGGIPGVPTFLAICIALIACQLLFAREHIWVPSAMQRSSVPAEKLRKVHDKLSRVAAKLDSLALGRLKWLTRGPALRVAAALILLLCLTVPPLEFLPFASTAPMLAIALISLALIVRDGLAILISGLISISALGYGTYLYWTGDMSEMADAASETISSAATATIASAAAII